MVWRGWASPGLLAVSALTAAQQVAYNVSYDAAQQSCSGQSPPAVTIAYGACVATLVPICFDANNDDAGCQVYQETVVAESHMEIWWDDCPVGTTCDCDLDVEVDTAWEVRTDGPTMTLLLTLVDTGYEAGHTVSAGFELDGTTAHTVTSGGSAAYNYTYSDCFAPSVATPAPSPLPSAMPSVATAAPSTLPTRGSDAPSLLPCVREWQSRRRRARGIELRADAASHLSGPREPAPAPTFAHLATASPTAARPTSGGAAGDANAATRSAHSSTAVTDKDAIILVCSVVGGVLLCGMSAAAILLWRRGARRNGITRRLAQCPGSVYAMLARCPGPPSALTAAAPAFGKPGSSARPGVELSVTSPKVAMV